MICAVPLATLLFAKRKNSLAGWKQGHTLRRVLGAPTFGRGSFWLSKAGNTQSSHDCIMPRDTRIAFFLMGELVAALKQAHILFNHFLFVGAIHDFKDPVLKLLMLDSAAPKNIYKLGSTLNLSH